MSTNSKKLEITEEIAVRMLQGRASVSKVGVVYSGVEINNVTHQMNDGTKFYWKDEEGNDTDRSYSIVNLKAMTPYQQAEAVAALQLGDYEAAVNKTLSLNVDHDTAMEWEAVGVGSLTLTKVMNKDGVEILVAKKFVPAQSIDAGRIDIQGLLAAANKQQKKGAPADLDTGADGE